MKLKGIRKKDANIIHYEFEGDIDIYTVGKLKKILINELKQDFELELGLDNVTKFDSAGFQLLVYIDREAKKMNKEIRITGKSIYVSKLFNLFEVSL